MTETDDALDKAHERLTGGKTGASTKATVTTRERHPSYHVFEETGDENVYRMLTTTTGEHAPSRQEAIKQVAKANAADDHTARTFLVIPAKEFKLLTRLVRTEVVETFE
jgi:hypothetical protein